MKQILKGAFIFFLVLIALLLMTSVMAPDSYQVERQIVINQPRDTVFDYLRLLKNQDEYGTWTPQEGEGMKKSYRGTDGQVGFVVSWESEDPNAGAGEQEIMRIARGERIDYELRLLKPMQSTSQGYLGTEALTDAQTRVKWGMTGQVGYPENLLLLFLDLETQLGNTLEESLENLKHKLEEKK